jgi:hypothetical protein
VKPRAITAPFGPIVPSEGCTQSAPTKLLQRCSMMAISFATKQLITLATMAGKSRPTLSAVSGLQFSWSKLRLVGC